jgi:hypothetical protein
MSNAATITLPPVGCALEASQIATPGVKPELWADLWDTMKRFL